MSCSQDLQYYVTCYRVNITDGTFYYAMSLSDPLSDDEILSPNCTDGNTRVCQYEPQGDLRRRIGTKIDKTYFGGELLFSSFYG